ncbi:hypothetical protein DRP77_06300, partial [Candidatus Poribacteria bacterium]
AAAAAPGAIGKAVASEKTSKVVYVHDPSFSSEMKLNPEPMRSAIEALIKELTGKSSTSEAWMAILKGYEKGQVVGIKVNCINRRCPSHPEVVYALVESMLDAGVAEEDIIIWDRRSDELERKGGYRLNREGKGVRCFGTDEPGWGYEEKPVLIEDQRVRLSRILTRCDHLINVPVLKDHGRAGVTLSLKNHLGSVDQPKLLHGNNCDPYLAKLNALPEIRGKTRLILLDAVLGICKGGPGGPPQFAPNILAASTDTVAIDRFGLDLINEERRKRDLDEATGLAKHLRTAASLGLGVYERERIRLVKI